MVCLTFSYDVRLNRDGLFTSGAFKIDPLNLGNVGYFSERQTNSKLMIQYPFGQIKVMWVEKIELFE